EAISAWFVRCPQRQEFASMVEAHFPSGSEYRSPFSRREFVRTLGTAMLAASVPVSGPSNEVAAPAAMEPSSLSTAETPIVRFYESLKDEQRTLLCFPFDHPKCSQVYNNWAIVQPTICDLSQEQQALCRTIFRNLCSEEGYERFQRQMDDDYGGFESYHVAF